MHRLARFLAAGLLWIGVSGQAPAQEARLTVSDANQSVELTQEQLDGLGQEIIETSTPNLPGWPEAGKAKFSGPLMADVLSEAGLAGETITAEAADGYRVDIPRERLTADGAILATRMNDEPLPEDKAPFWIVFPYDRSPDINHSDHYDWSVWALTKLDVN